MTMERAAADPGNAAFRGAYAVGIALNVFVLLAGLMAFIFANMFIFVNWLRYDYVTVSSVLFSFIVFVYTLFGIVGILQAKRVSAFLGGVVALLVFPFVLSSGLKLYEHFLHPQISKALNLPELYRHVMGLPFASAAGSVGSFLPLLRKLADVSVNNTAVDSVVVAVISALMTEYFKRIIFPNAKKVNDDQTARQGI